VCIPISFGALCYLAITKYYGDQFEKDEVGKECGMPRIVKKCIQNITCENCEEDMAGEI
jgi:hypothetical protein